MFQSFTRRGVLAGVAASLPFIASSRALGMAHYPRTVERIFVGRIAPLTHSQEFDSDLTLAQVTQVVCAWRNLHPDADWLPEDLAFHLDSIYAEVVMEPVALAEYIYVVDTHGVVHEICLGLMVLNLLPKLGEDRIQIRVERWLSM